MHSPSPKTRFFIQEALRLLRSPEVERAWVAWSEQHPFRRSEGFINNELDYLPRYLAESVLHGLELLEMETVKNLQRNDISREDAISAENNIGLFHDLESEICADLLAAA